jgi:hypothetical protein
MRAASSPGCKPGNICPAKSVYCDIGTDEGARIWLIGMTPRSPSPSFHRAAVGNPGEALERTGLLTSP